MRSFDVDGGVLDTVPGEVVALLRRVDIGAGSEALYRHQLPALLAELTEHARGESITASSAIEGVVVADTRRAQQIIAGHSGPLKTRDEQQIAGYREALDYLFAPGWQPLNVGLLLHLHRLLWSHTATDGGQLKTDDNLVVDRAPDGTLAVRFTPVSAVQTEFFLTELIARWDDARAAQRHHPVLLIGLFVLDLTVIHPFADGNGRVARVVTNALLAEAGYGVGRWVSLEQLIAETADEYYAALLASTKGWHDGTADVWPWLTYFITTLATAYDRFARGVATARTSSSKNDRVRAYVLSHADPLFRIADIRAALPGVSDPTIRLALSGLKAEGVITPDRTGRSAVWRRTG
jgi:Fic family protein